MTSFDPTSSTVLVVEDEALLRFYATDTLEDNGFTVVEAADANEALRLMKLHPEIAVLFTDIQLPGQISGLELAQLVHKNWPTVLLLITSGRLRPSQGEIPDVGQFIAKPYTPEQIVGGIKKLFGSG